MITYASDFGAWYVWLNGVEYKFAQPPTDEDIAEALARYVAFTQGTLTVEAEDGTTIE